MWEQRWSPNQGREAKLRLHGCTDLEELIWANKSQMVSQSASDNICIPNVVFVVDMMMWHQHWKQNDSTVIHCFPFRGVTTLNVLFLNACFYRK